MRNFTKQIFGIALCLIVGFSSYAALSQGGVPYSKSNAVQAKSSLPSEVLPKPDLSVVSQVDAVTDAMESKPYRVGINYPVNYNAVNSGTWETTSDGGSLWRLRIHMDDAKAISINYHNFFLPVGGKVFLYNEYENHVIGAFTSEYNNHDQIRATQMIEGSTITIEYYAPAGVVQTPIIELKEVVYYYRGVEDFVNPFVEEATGSTLMSEKAESCQIDVACSEGAAWQNQIDAAIHYVFTQGASSYVCSASMINNTAEDCTPYVLSAWHCGEPNAGSNISSWVWYWNYQKTTCSPGNGNLTDPSKGTQTMTGGTVVASSGNGTLNNPPGTNQLAGSDFYLVELNSTPPTAYNAFYAGWNRTNTGATSGVGVHHPAGSAKKISTFTSSLTSATYNSGASNAHWRVVWSATTNGHGVTEGGSSGSPIFDQNGRIVGQLSGGSSFCTSTGSPDLYGKMYTNWDQCGTSTAAQLAPWLDPLNTGVTVLDGAYEPCNAANPPTCNINASTLNITAGGSVNFTDGSSGNPTSWAWNFDNTAQGGVAPGTSTVQNPGAVTYSNVGTYEVELTATNANGSCTSTATVNVTAFSGCDSLMNIVDTNSITIYNSNAGYVTGTNDYGDLAKAEKYSGYSGTHVTGSDIFIYGLADGGNGTTVDLTVWDDNAGLPGTVLGQTTYSLAQLDAVLTGGIGVVFLPFDNAVAVNGADFYIGLDFSGVDMAAGDTIGIVSKFASVSTPANTGYEQWSDGTWYDMPGAGWGGDWSMYMSAHVTDAPVSGSAAVSASTVCTGSPVTFTSTGTNVTGQTWYTTGGTPATATTANTTVTYATAGTYMAYLVLDGSCNGQVIDSVAVTVTDGPTVTNTTTDPTCAGNDGSITISATGGATPYTYSIDGGSTFVGTATFTGLSANTYNIVVQDANGCESTDVATINAGSGALTVSSTSVDPSCAGGDGSITISASAGVMPYTYSIDGGSTFVGTSTFTGLNDGTYSIVVQDANGCQGTDAVTLSPGTASITVTTTNVDPSCGNSDGQITVAATGGTTPYTYSIDGGSTFVGTATFTGLAVATYNVVVEDANGCQGTTTASLINSGGPTSSATSTDVSCNGLNDGTITISATGGSTPYTYSTDGVTYVTSSTFTGMGAGTYTVYVEDAGGCTSTSSVVISEPSAVAHTVSVVDASCGMTNGSITVTATGGQSPYTYSLDGGTGQSTGSFTGLSAATYTIQVTDASGCTSSITSHTVAGGTAPTLTSTVTNETCMNANGEISVSATGGTGPYTYTLNGGSAQPTGVYTGLSAGSYLMEVTDGNGCTASTTVTVTNVGGFTLIVNPAGGQTICLGNSANISASGAGVGASYTWDQGLGVGASHNVTPTVTTTYSVVAVDGSGCSSTSSVTITVQSAPTVTVIPTNPTICSGESVSLTATGATTYVWNTGVTTSTINVSPTNQTTYTVIGQNGSCSGTPVQVVVGVNPSPTVIAGSDVINIQAGGTVNFNNSGSNATSYNWNFGDGQTSTTGFVAHTYNVQGTYTVILTGTIGSCTDSDTLTINVGVSSVDQVTLDNAVNVYPNPNAGLFNLKMEFGEAQDVEISLFSAIGQLIETRQLDNVTGQVETFNFANEAEGVYIVRVKTNSGTVTKRMTISK